MEINDRIRMIMQSHGLTAGEFADKIGVQRSNVSHILNGRNRPGFEFLEKVVKAFPRVQAYWLLTGVNRQQEAVHESPTTVNTEKPSENLPSSPQKQIVRIVTFFDDRSFEVAFPSAE